MDKLIKQLKKNYPTLDFVSGPNFNWSLSGNKVTYVRQANDKASKWALIHEVAHAILGHRGFTSDFSLLRQEVEAWAKAGKLATKYSLTIDPDYIEECLDTYRNWLYARSTCPRCLNACLQTNESLEYLCHNCGNSWRVSRARFCRPYRRTSDQKLSI